MRKKRSIYKSVKMGNIQSDSLDFYSQIADNWVERAERLQRRRWRYLQGH